MPERTPDVEPALAERHSVGAMPRSAGCPSHKKLAHLLRPVRNGSAPRFAKASQGKSLALQIVSIRR